jgi:hypothetical protein
VRQGQPGNYVICVKAEDRVTHVRIRQVEGSSVADSDPGPDP